MNNFGHSNKIPCQNDLAVSLSEQVRQILAGQKLDAQRIMIKNLSAGLNINLLDCAAALAFLVENKQPLSIDGDNLQTRMFKENLARPIQTFIKFVRYRLDVGYKNNVTPELLKKILVEESGVDINNITNIRIQDYFTLIDLPDEMPQEIFQHLKTFEINHCKLDIRRIKPKRKKAGNKFGRRHSAQKNTIPHPTTES